MPLCTSVYMCLVVTAEKGLASWLSFLVSVSLSLSHWHPGSGVVLIVLIFDLCTLTYFIVTAFIMLILIEN